MPARTRISVSLPSDLVGHIDERVRAGVFASRAEAIEVALRAAGRRERDDEITAYYVGQTRKERREERAWGEVGAQGLAVSMRAFEASTRRRKDR